MTESWANFSDCGSLAKNFQKNTGPKLFQKAYAAGVCYAHAANVVLLKQDNSTWGDDSYGSCSPVHTVGKAGCGPTSLAMIVNFWYPGKNIPPDLVARQSAAEGFYKCNGTDAKMFSMVGEKYYGLATYYTSNWDKAKIILKHKLPVIAYTKKNDTGYFSHTSNHFVVFDGFNSTNKTVSVKDPKFSATTIPEADAISLSKGWYYFLPEHKDQFNPYQNPPVQT